MGRPRKPICGVGINDADYVVNQWTDGKQVMCSFYRAWRSMLERCYSAKYLQKYPTYIGCTVVPEWHSFMAFRAWMIEQDWQDKQLDKDIIEVGNKVYGPDTCAFVSQEVNYLLLDNAAKRGQYPIGVYLNQRRGRFQAQITMYGKIKHLGYFDTPAEAANAYRTAKAAHIREIASQQTDKRVVAGLLRHAERHRPALGLIRP